MKLTYKYRFGYINLDDENLYLTNTGNWSEIPKLKEKSKRTKFKQDLRQLKFGAFLMFWLFASMFLYGINLISSRISLAIVIGLPLAGYYVYQYIRTDLGPAFVIPWSKLKHVEQEGKLVVLHFMNGDGEEDEVQLAGLDGLGMEKLTEFGEVAHLKIEENIDNKGNLTSVNL